MSVIRMNSRRLHFSDSCNLGIQQFLIYKEKTKLKVEKPTQASPQNVQMWLLEAADIRKMKYGQAA